MALPGDIREIVREEVSWRLGIKWFGGPGLYSEKYVSPGTFVRQAYFLDEAPDGDLVILDRYSVVKCDREYRVKLRIGSIVPPSIFEDLNFGMLDVNWETGRVLVSEPYGARKIYEFDLKTGKKTLELTTLKRPDGTTIDLTKARATACYERAGEKYWRPNEEYTGRIAIVGNGVGRGAVIVERDGTVVEEVPVPVTGYPRMGIACENHVVIPCETEHVVKIWWRTTGEVKVAWVYPNPSHFSYGSGMLAIASVYFPPCVWTHDTSPRPLPTISERCARLTSKQTILLTTHGSVMELDLRVPEVYRMIPVIYPNVSGSLEAGAETPIYPIPAMLTRYLCIYGWSSKDATLRIWRLRPAGSNVEQFHAPKLDENGNPIWDLYDEVSIPAGKLAAYEILTPVGMYGVSLKMGASAGDYQLYALIQPLW